MSENITSGESTVQFTDAFIGAKWDQTPDITASRYFAPSDDIERLTRGVDASEGASCRSSGSTEKSVTHSLHATRSHDSSPTTLNNEETENRAITSRAGGDGVVATDDDNNEQVTEYALHLLPHSQTEVSQSSHVDQVHDLPVAYTNDYGNISVGPGTFLNSHTGDSSSFADRESSVCWALPIEGASDGFSDIIISPQATSDNSTGVRSTNTGSQTNSSGRVRVTDSSSACVLAASAVSENLADSSVDLCALPVDFASSDDCSADGGSDTSA